MITHHPVPGILLMTILLLMLPMMLFADFSVVSLSPTDGATDVAIDATWEITFSDPVDTTARFIWPEEFPLGLLASPNEAVGDPDSIVWSSDLKTLRIYNLKLQEDTRYIFAVIDAKSQGGEYLKQPAMTTFTTGAHLPAAQISGTVIYQPGVDIQRTTVALYEFIGDENPVALATLNASNQFTLNYVPDGWYYLMAVLDIDHQGCIDPEPITDFVGMWDADADGWADGFEVKNGQSSSGYDITVYSGSIVSARQRYAEVEARAKTWNPDAALLSILPSEMRWDGYSGFWIYQFYSPGSDSYFTYVALQKILAPFPGMPLWGDVNMPFLPPDWIDSITAAQKAELSGGQQFRLNHADAVILAVLATFDIADDFLTHDHKLLRTSSGLQAVKRLPQRTPALHKTGALQDTVSAWDIMYQSQADEAYVEFIIDAATGDLIRIFSMEPSTALTNLDAANREIQNWATDAQLVMIGNHLCTVDSTGKALWWYFLYYSPSHNENMAVFVISGVIQGMQPPGWSQIVDKPLGVFAIDSDQALAVAEAHGGAEFREQNNDKALQVDCRLAAGLFPESPDKSVWNIVYRADGDRRDFFVDAQTGNLVTRTEQPTPMQRPDSHALLQNYPNPFNPETCIHFQLAHPGFVEIAIYNVKGERVKTLSGEFRAAGAHHVIWDGADAGGRSVAGGVYIYRMKIGAFQADKKMLLVR